MFLLVLERVKDLGAVVAQLNLPEVTAAAQPWNLDELRIVNDVKRMCAGELNFRDIEALNPDVCPALSHRENYGGLGFPSVPDSAQKLEPADRAPVAR